MKVLFIGDLNQDLLEYQQFSQRHQCIHYEITTKEKLLHDFAHDLKDIDAIYGAWLGFVPVGGFRGELIEAAPKLLKVILICLVGYDGYDGKALAEKGVVLTNVPSIGAAEPVADLVTYNTINAFRQFSTFSNHLGANTNHTVFLRKWLDQLNQFDSVRGQPRVNDVNKYAFGEMVNNRPVLSPRGHDVVIVGFGNIGRTIGSRLAHLGMNIHYVKRTPLTADEHQQLGYNAVYHLLLLLASFADLVVIAAPLTPETKHLINRDLIAMMDKPFRLINIGRGPIVDEDALVEGLKQGKVLYAGLDVFEHEPTVTPELFGRSDVVLTPHVGALTTDNFNFTAKRALANLELVLSGESALDRVN